MADLVTHLCTALLPGAVVRGRLVPLIAVGTVLPDAVGRAIPLGLERAADLGIPVPPWLLWPWAALHEPVGWAAVCAALGTAFVRPDRAPATAALAAGCLLHTGLDVLQFHHGEGYLLLAPLSAARFELGWIGSEATVPIAVPLAAVTGAAWLPAAIEARSGVPACRPRVLLALMAPIAIAAAVAGPAAAGWVGAAALGVAAGSWRWWDRHPREYLAVGTALVGAVAVAHEIAQ